MGLMYLDGIAVGDLSDCHCSAIKTCKRCILGVPRGIKSSDPRVDSRTMGLIKTIHSRCQRFHEDRKKDPRVAASSSTESRRRTCSTAADDWSTRRGVAGDTQRGVVGETRRGVVGETVLVLPMQRLLLALRFAPLRLVPIRARRRHSSIDHGRRRRANTAPPTQQQQHGGACSNADDPW